VAWALFLLVLLLDVLAAILLVARHLAHRRRLRLHDAARSLMGIVASGGALDRRGRRFLRRHRWAFLEECSRAADEVELPEAARQRLAAALEEARLHAILVRDLHAGDRYRRARAAVYLPLVPGPAVQASLIRALESEKSRPITLALCGSLAAMEVTVAIPTIIDTLAGQPARTQRSLRGLLCELGQGLAAYLPLLLRRQEREIQMLLIAFAERHPSTELGEYLVSRVDSPDLDVSHAAFRALASGYAATLDYERYLRHDDFLIRNVAAESLGRLPTTRSLALLFGCLGEPLMRRSVTLALSAIVRARPQHLRTLMIRCLNTPQPQSRAALLDVLSDYADYLVPRLVSPQGAIVAEVLELVVGHGRLSDLANFLNANRVAEIESRALAVLAGCLRADPACAARLRELLDGRLLARLGLEPAVTAEEPAVRREHPRLRLLAALLAVGAGAVPAACLIAAALDPSAAPGGPSLAGRFLTAFNSAFAVYAASLNLVYLVLLASSAFGVARQARFASLLRSSFLFKEGVLPSISILSPAFNEEATIVESVRSLLKLHYPDYEVIVVNDGSRDATLARLIAAFGLERTDVFVHRYLNTRDLVGLFVLLG
jgi:hypothetical protein